MKLCTNNYIIAILVFTLSDKIPHALGQTVYAQLPCLSEISRSMSDCLVCFGSSNLPGTHNLGTKTYFDLIRYYAKKKNKILSY